MSWVSTQSLQQEKTSLKSRDGPVVLGTGHQAPESQANVPEDRGTKGHLKVPKAMMNLGPEWGSPACSCPGSERE